MVNKRFTANNSDSTSLQAQGYHCISRGTCDECAQMPSPSINTRKQIIFKQYEQKDVYNVRNVSNYHLGIEIMRAKIVNSVDKIVFSVQ